MDLTERTPITTFDQIVDAVHSFPVRRIAVAVAQDPAVLAAAVQAQQGAVAEYLLVGDRDAIQRVADDAELQIEPTSIVHQPDPVGAAEAAVRAVSSGQADILMKGYIHTDDLLRAVLNKEFGLRTRAIMSHVFLWETLKRGRLTLVTDGAMNIAPSLERKADIILNAVHLANILGIPRPRVALLGAVEVVNPAMPATVDAAAIASMSQRRQFSAPCVIDGPFALDNAINVEAARHKKLDGPVAGEADILVVPDIEAGNMLAKAFSFLGCGHSAGVVVGASHPIVLTSRADSAAAKFYSIATAVLMTNFQRELRLKIGKVHY